MTSRSIGRATLATARSSGGKDRNGPEISIARFGDVADQYVEHAAMTRGQLALNVIEQGISAGLEPTSRELRHRGGRDCPAMIVSAIARAD